ncbi:hypothetical protein IV73_GL001068 [Weissella kandleri]|uniref:DUF8208 domain-containing protein n=1 Tax=Weissella kandleri TaxID=1616 RepID=A0A0R2JKG2_9LACO|nr:hypothetical protein [Weissella kandleri]KRN74791.1 hypothetical protein IV73_GL001068 [Weissella kandleri]
MLGISSVTLVAAEKLPSLPESGPDANFYNAWIDYLNPTPHIFLNFVEWIMHGIAVLLYDLANGVQEAWSSAWRLSDFSQIFTSTSRDYDGSVDQSLSGVFTSNNLGKLIWIMLLVGFVVMAVVMAVQMFQYSISGGKKGKDWPKGIAISAIIIAMLPMGISSMMSIAQGVNSEINVAVSPVDNLWKNNSVSLTKLNDDKFNINGKDISDYSPLSKSGKEMRDASSVIKGSQFTETMDDIDKYKDEDVFKKKLGVNDQVQDLSGGNWATGKTFSETYPVVKANWIGIIGGEIVFIVVGFLSIIELLLRFFRLAYYTLAILYFALRDVHGKKAVQVLQLIEGSVTGMAMMPISLILFYAWVNFGFEIIKPLSWWPFTILSISILISGYKGLMGSMSLIDEWTGTQSGHGSSLQSVAGTMMAARAITGAAKGVASKVSSGAPGLEGFADKFKKAGDKNDAINNASPDGDGGKSSTGNSNANISKSQKLANMAGKTVGMAKNANNIPGAVKDAGKQSLQNGVQSVKDKASEIQGKAQGYGDSVKSAFNDGNNSVNDFIDRHSSAGAENNEKTNDQLNKAIMGQEVISRDNPQNIGDSSENAAQTKNSKINNAIMGEEGEKNNYPKVGGSGIPGRSTKVNQNVNERIQNNGNNGHDNINSLVNNDGKQNINPNNLDAYGLENNNFTESQDGNNKPIENDFNYKIDEFADVGTNYDNSDPYSSEKNYDL